jgi:hypothetical protein
MIAALAVAAAPASGSVTLGQVGPPAVGPCEGFDVVQESVTVGNSYMVPGTGTITQWRTYGNSSPGSPQLKLKVFRLIAPVTYLVVGHAGPQTVTGTGTATNTFPANIRVEAGDLLGVNGVSSWCILADDGGRYAQYNGDLADGASAPFTTSATRRLNVEATFVPDNGFSLARTIRNKKKGIATLTFKLPNPGQITGTGRGAKVTATTPKNQGSVPAPGSGPSQLLVKPTGRKRATLNDTGKVSVTVTATYTPIGGDPKRKSLKVKLKKKL